MLIYKKPTIGICTHYYEKLVQIIEANGLFAINGKDFFEYWVWECNLQCIILVIIFIELVPMHRYKLQD